LTTTKAAAASVSGSPVTSVGHWFLGLLHLGVVQARPECEYHLSLNPFRQDEDDE
jgi:translation elongation factor EF-4